MVFKPVIRSYDVAKLQRRVTQRGCSRIRGHRGPWEKIRIIRRGRPGEISDYLIGSICTNCYRGVVYRRNDVVYTGIVPSSELWIPENMLG